MSHIAANLEDLRAHIEPLGLADSSLMIVVPQNRRLSSVVGFINDQRDITGRFGLLVIGQQEAIQVVIRNWVGTGVGPAFERIFGALQGPELRAEGLVPALGRGICATLYVIHLDSATDLIKICQTSGNVYATLGPQEDGEHPGSHNGDDQDDQRGFDDMDG